MKSRWSKSESWQHFCQAPASDFAHRADCSSFDSEQHLFTVLESQTCEEGTGPPFSFRFLRQYVGVYSPDCPGVEAVQNSLKLYFDPSTMAAHGTALPHWLSCGQVHLDSSELSAGLKTIDRAHSQSSSGQLRVGLFLDFGRTIQQVLKVIEFPRAPSHLSDQHWLVQGYHGLDSQSGQGANESPAVLADRVDFDMMLMVVNPEKEDFEYFRAHGDPPYSPTAAFLRLLVQSRFGLYRLVSQQLFGYSPCIPPPFKSQVCDCVLHVQYFGKGGA